MEPILRNQMAKLEFVGPRKALLASQIRRTFTDHPCFPKPIRDWRLHRLNRHRFLEQAALLCFGRKCVDSSASWAVALWPEEHSDIDCVFRRRAISGDEQFELVQLKEWVPEELNKTQTLQSLLDELPTSYPVSPDVAVGIYMNRIAQTKLADLRVPKLNISALWLFGAGGEPPHNSFLFGNVLQNPCLCFFSRPRFRPGESSSDWKTALDDE